jgi:hypothetical protein
VIVCDTGPLVAAALSNDRNHAACVALFNKLHHERRELLVPATVVAEVGYLLAREAGVHLEALFLRSLAEGDFTPVELAAGDFSRMAELVETSPKPSPEAGPAVVLTSRGQTAYSWPPGPSAMVIGFSPVGAGPTSTAPVVALNSEPWQGQTITPAVES